MSKITRFEELECWKASRVLVKSIFRKSESFKRDQATCIQLRRAAISIMNNIAEGFGRFSNKDFVRFLQYSSSSANEVKSMLYLLEDIKYLSLDDLKQLHAQVDKVRNLTLGLIRYLSNKK